MIIDHSYAEKLQDLVSPVGVTPVIQPKLSLVNESLTKLLNFGEFGNDQTRLFNSLFEQDGLLNQKAVAQKYGGHQFGSWNPELGDGRGLLLAEVTDKEGAQWDLHLKGAGKTPYSRFGDGRAVLRSTIREYLASEALHYLGIPSSRSLCLISSNELVYREKQEKSAMMIRACQSHIRFGHFEYFYHSKQLEKLAQLFDYTLANHFPQCLDQSNPKLALLEEIVLSTADLIAKWQAFGFCHGVMNTDNMSIHGITFDYGPYAFLDAYVPDYICNHSDHSGRYAFDQQPGVALWNLNALAHAFTPYIEIDDLKEALLKFQPRLTEQYANIMRAKMGFSQEMPDDMVIVNEWLALLHQDKQDYTLSFRRLSDPNYSIVDGFIDRKKAQIWLEKYQQRLGLESISAEQRQQKMLAVNPKYILRNYLAQIAIDRAEEGDFSECERLLAILKSPYKEQAENVEYAKPPPHWGQGMEISCSS